MNQLAITLCLLMEAVLTMAKTVRLPNPLINKVPSASYGFPPPEPSSKSLYSYSYNTDTGIQAQEQGDLNYINTDQEALEARGSYSYTDNEGNYFQVSYVANENGFQPEGAHLHTVPPLIKKALQYIAEHPEENENN